MSTRKTSFVTKWLLFGLLVLGLAGSVAGAATGDVPLTEVKREFFTSLSPDQRLSLLEALDRGQQLTAQELGAKYRWGHVPPDRQPPFFLARWWKSLSPGERQRERLDWFRRNYRRLDLDRAARELGLQDRLTRVYRRLRQNDDRPARKFEPISFPGRDLTFGEAGEDRRSAGVYRPESDTDSPGDQSAKSSRNSPQLQPGESPDEGTADKDKASRENATSSPPVPPTQSRERADTEWKRIQRYQGETVIYRREGDEISVVRRSDGGDTGWTSPTPEPETNAETTPRAVDPDPPSADPDETSVPRLRFPDPKLRRNESRERRLELPPVRHR